MNLGSHFLTPEEVAVILKVDRATIYKHLRAGAIPALRFGKLWRIKQEDLDGLVSTKKKKAG